MPLALVTGRCLGRSALCGRVAGWHEGTRGPENGLSGGKSAPRPGPTTVSRRAGALA